MIFTPAGSPPPLSSGDGSGMPVSAPSRAQPYSPSAGAWGALSVDTMLLSAGLLAALLLPPPQAVRVSRAHSSTGKSLVPILFILTSSFMAYFCLPLPIRTQTGGKCSAEQQKFLLSAAAASQPQLAGRPRSCLYPQPLSTVRPVMNTDS